MSKDDVYQEYIRLITGVYAAHVAELEIKLKLARGEEMQDAHVMADQINAEIMQRLADAGFDVRTVLPDA